MRRASSSATRRAAGIHVRHHDPVAGLRQLLADGGADAAAAARDQGKTEAPAAAWIHWTCCLLAIVPSAWETATAALNFCDYVYMLVAHI